MQVIRILIATDRGHIGIQTLALLKTVFLKSHSFPLCKGVYDFHFLVALLPDSKLNRALHAV